MSSEWAEGSPILSSFHIALAVETTRPELPPFASSPLRKTEREEAPSIGICLDASPFIPQTWEEVGRKLGGRRKVTQPQAHPDGWVSGWAVPVCNYG